MIDDPIDAPEADEPSFPTRFCGGSLDGQIITCRIGRHWWHSRTSDDKWYKVTTVGPNRELVCLFLLHGMSDGDRLAAIETGTAAMTQPRARVL